MRVRDLALRVALVLVVLWLFALVAAEARW
jgi:hypothetical protein